MTAALVHRRHVMPFGAELLPDGRIRFRLWAPSAQRVHLCLGPRRLAMDAVKEGWFELTTERLSEIVGYQFQIDGGLYVPDPASRYQPDDVHGVSQVIDPSEYDWRDGDWRGRPWHEAVIYELHVGCFNGGRFADVAARLDYLVELGVTAVELMPVADFPGRRNWGYDGVLPFAPDAAYGTPDELKALIDGAHGKGLMVLLDVVYNHFGPEGNYLHSYAPAFFTARHHTPWGDAINFDGADSHWVRQFFIHNALFWLEEYHFDGLRLDAVHAILDDSQPDFLTELARTVHKHFHGQRHVHLVLENDNNAARYLARTADGRPQLYVAQWNDDIHHALHVLLTGEEDGYYQDYAQQPMAQLARSLTEGFAYQGEASAYRDGHGRGEPSADLPPTAFVAFLQNHDQIGNRAFGERIGMLTGEHKLTAVTALLLLAPAPPLLFMGEEWGAINPFLFFCDFSGELAQQVRAGRRREFARFPAFSTPADRERIPDPGADDTFAEAALDWHKAARPAHHEQLVLHRELLRLRRTHIVPLLAQGTRPRAEAQPTGERGLRVNWHFAAGKMLTLLANLGDNNVGMAPPGATLLYACGDDVEAELRESRLPPWSVVWLLLDLEAAP